MYHRGIYFPRGEAETSFGDSEERTKGRRKKLIKGEKKDKEKGKKYERKKINLKTYYMFDFLSKTFPLCGQLGIKGENVITT